MVKVEDDVVHVVSDVSRQEFRVRAKDIKLAAGMSSGILANSVLLDEKVSLGGRFGHLGEV